MLEQGHFTLLDLLVSLAQVQCQGTDHDAFFAVGHVCKQPLSPLAVKQADMAAFIGFVTDIVAIGLEDP